MTVEEQREIDNLRQTLELTAEEMAHSDTLVVSSRMRLAVKIASILARQVGNNSLIVAIETADGLIRRCQSCGEVHDGDICPAQY